VLTSLAMKILPIPLAGYLPLLVFVVLILLPLLFAAILVLLPLLLAAVLVLSLVPLAAGFLLVLSCSFCSE